MTRRRDGSRRTSRVLIPSTLLILTCCVALAAAGEPQGASDATTLAGVGGPLQVDAPGELSPAQEDAIKRGEALDAPLRATVEVDLDAVAAHPHLAGVPAQLAQPLASAEAIGLPVLLPGDQPEALDSALLTVGDGWYEASMQLDGGRVMLVVAGSNKATLRPDLTEEVGDLTPFQTDQGAIVSRTHGIVSASFVRFGEVAYMVDIECADPVGDARCTEDSFVHDVIGALALAGGR